MYQLHFLHAIISYEVHVHPPKEFYLGNSVIWKLNKAMYGLRGSPKSWHIHFRQVMANHGVICLQPEPNIYICGSDHRPSTCIKSNEISIGCMTNGPPDVNDPITDDCLPELISSQKLSIILVYVDDNAMASMLPGGNWIHQMLKDEFIIKSSGILKADGDTVQFLGRSTTKHDQGFALQVKYGSNRCIRGTWLF